MPSRLTTSVASAGLLLALGALAGGALVVEALVPNRQGRLQPGLFATARIELPAGAPSVLVPTAAVRTEAGVSKLWVVGDRVEALRGVAAGEQVVAAYSDTLQDGAPVSAATPTGGR